MCVGGGGMGGVDREGYRSVYVCVYVCECVRPHLYLNLCVQIYICTYSLERHQRHLPQVVL